LYSYSEFRDKYQWCCKCRGIESLIQLPDTKKIPERGISLRSLNVTLTSAAIAEPGRNKRRSRGINKREGFKRSPSFNDQNEALYLSPPGYCQRT
jgi:hypothetical protein